MEKLKNKTLISGLKEDLDTLALIAAIRNSSWVSSATILVNCFPEYSSKLTQMANHQLSHLNRNELFETIDLQMPYPNMSQVWSPQDKAYRQFDKYLLDWVKEHLRPSFNYLFLSAVTEEIGHKVKAAVRTKLEPDNYRFGTLYLQSNSLYVPDFLIETIKKPALFGWENMENPNRQ